MGGSVSLGRDNDELVDTLIINDYIRTERVEYVFRALDRADYMTRDARDEAYKDNAWRNGPLHLSAPCIYGVVMESLELKPGLSFLNVGSGTGFLSTMVGLILGSQGINHGVEVRSSVVEYANKRLRQFLENSPVLDEFDFCEPKFFLGNGLCLAPLAAPYDRVYCGAGCPSSHRSYFNQLVKIGGILVIPEDDRLVQAKRVDADNWVCETVLNVSYAMLVIPSKEEAANTVTLDEQTPPPLQVMARGAIRTAMREGLRRRHPDLQPALPRPPAKNCPRRICIPVDEDNDVEGLANLHDLYRDEGAPEMNALLGFMLRSVRQHRANAEPYGDEDLDGGGSSDEMEEAPPEGAHSSDEDDADYRVRRCGLITLDFRDILEGSDETPRTEDRNAQIEDANARTENANARTEGENSRTEDNSRTEEGDIRTEEGNVRAVDTNARTEDGNARTLNENAQTESDNQPLGAENSRADDNSKMETGDVQMSSSPRSERKSSDDRTKRENKRSGDRRSWDERRVRRSFGESSRADPNDGENSNPDVPAEVEIYLGKTTEAAPGTSRWSMTWGEVEPRRLDSGVGEDASPESATPTASNHDDASPHSTTPPTTDHDDCRLECDSPPSDYSDHEYDEPQDGEGNNWLNRSAEKRTAAAESRARRVRLSLHMKRGVKELPLPHALKKYVNFLRCFEF